VELYNVLVPTKLEDLKEQTFVGSAETFMAVIINSKGRIWTKQLEHFKNTHVGEISIYAEEMTRMKHSISFNLAGIGLKAKDFFSRKSDPYIIVHRANKDVLPLKLTTDNFRCVGPEQRVPIYRSEVVKKSLSPVWARCEIAVQQLCKGEEERPIVFEVWDWNLTMADKFMGYAETTYAELHRASVGAKPLVLQLSDPNKDKNQKGKKKRKRICGTLEVQEVAVVTKYSFLDYVSGGLDIGLIVAVDFTRSNGDPQNKESLHYCDTQEPNEYVMAIRAVGEILEHYDSDKKYPVYGFGAKIPPSRSIVSHNFSLKGNFFDPEVDGLRGILDAYRNALNVVTLHGPTMFHEVIEHAGRMAAQFSNPKPSDDVHKYFILLIVTDGVINDMQETINAVVKCSEYPMSIIIVGVGEEDFSLMDELDADITPLYSTTEKKYMERDIVQFVPFADFKDRSYYDLARCTLDEVPREVINYLQSRHCPPRDDVWRKEHNEKSKYSNRVGGKEEKVTEEVSSLAFLNKDKAMLVSQAISSGFHKIDVEAAFETGVPSSDMRVVLDVLTHADYRDKSKGNSFQQSLSMNVSAEKSPENRGARLVRCNTSGAWSAEDKTPVADKPLPGEAMVPDRDEFASQLFGHRDKAPKKKKPRKDDDDIANVCKVCFENTIDTVLLECGHQVVCEACSVDIGALCPLCRQTISRIVRTYNP